MKFDTPAGVTPIDRQAVVGQPHVRVEGRMKTTGTARYAAEYHDVGPNLAYGYILGAAIAKGRITGIDLRAARAAPGVITIVTYETAGPVGGSNFFVHRMLASPAVDHYHQPVAVVVAETFEQARAAAGLVVVRYEREQGSFDLAAVKDSAPIGPEAPFGGPANNAVGDFDGAFAAAAVKVDQTYTVPDQAHAMMEPHASIARWDGDRLTCWTSIQQLVSGKRDLGKIIGIPKENIRLISHFIGGGFGGKWTAHGDLVLAAVAARLAGRPVKVVLQRPLMFNNTTHRAKTIQRVRLGAGRDGRITAIGHDSWSGNLPGGGAEPAPIGTRDLYAGENRLLRRYLARLDLMEANAMRAPGEAPGMMALEIAMDELAEKLGMDPVALRVINDTQVDPEKPQRPFSTRALRGVPEDRGRAVRLEPAAGHTRQPARWAVAGRHGRGQRGPGCSHQQVGGTRAARAGRHRAGRVRHDRYRHRQLHDHLAGRRRNDGLAAESRGDETRGLRFAGDLRFGRSTGCRILHRRRLRSLCQAARPGCAAAGLQRDATWNSWMARCAREAARCRWPTRRSTANSSPKTSWSTATWRSVTTGRRSAPISSRSRWTGTPA
jgi:xanthine dehydrogenase YagR molybdenum-binding subunit